MKRKKSFRISIFSILVAFLATVLGIQLLIAYAVGDDKTVAYDFENGGIVQFYACTRGNVAEACAALRGHSSTYDFENGGIVQFYACTRGNVAEACAALHGEVN